VGVLSEEAVGERNIPSSLENAFEGDTPSEIRRYELLLAEQGESLRRYVRGLCRDEATADDVFQEVSLVALRALPELAQVVDLMAWMKGVARRKAKRHYSNPKREVLDDAVFEHTADEAPDSERGLSAKQLVGRAMTVLSESSAEVVLRRHVLGENSSEIAIQSGRSGASVRMKLKRALNTARGSLRPEGASNRGDEPMG